MKTSFISRVGQNLINAIILFVTLSAFQLAQAQTYTGDSHLKDSPAELRAQVIKLQQGLSFQVNVENGQGGPVSIQIRDANGKTVFNEVRYSQKFSRLYDLSQLGEGTYTFQVQGRSGEAYTRSYRFLYPGPEAIALDGSNSNQLVLQPEKRVVKR